MEKVNFKNSRNLNLVGNFHPATSKSVIIMCHGFTSDKSSRGRFDRFANTFHQHGYSVLAFDFSGCGESDDDRIKLDNFTDDLKAAISFVKNSGYTQIALYGHSLGSRVCLESFNDQDIKTMVLSGAGTGPIKYNWNDHFTKVQMKELEEKGYITEHIEGKRKTILIDKQMLVDFEDFSQESLLKRVTCPVFLIHGDTDWEERLLCTITKQGLKWLSEDSCLQIIKGANHSFMEHLVTIETVALEWFKKHMSLT